jgi:two-component system CheB/CheR fusion protein
MTENDVTETSGFPVVGIGASAGGVDSLRSLFKSLPEKTGLAFVVLQHLHPDHPSYLAELLGKWTGMPINEAVDGMPVERDHVYLIQPGEVLTIENGVLRSRPFSDPERVYLDLIDGFFKSLAADRGRQAIAVVLSGTGTDGAAGITCLKQAGGRVFVQDPTTALYDGMPCAAIGTGAVNYILPVESIASELLRCTLPLSDRPMPDTGDVSGITQPLDDILALIRRQAGFDLSGYKTKPLHWQIQRRMAVRRIEHLRDYASLLQDDRAEFETLIRDIPIHVTDFFRDAEAWDVLASDVIMPLIREHTGDRPLRAWTPACSTGEEAYSVAMLLAERSEQMKKPVDFQIFATDASPEIVARASRGQFSSAGVRPIAPERLERFFYAVDGVYRAKKTLRKKIVFAPQHLLTDPPFSNLDLVTCRNLLIYLEPYAQQRVLSLLHASLRIGGYLFLGSGESLSSKQRGFKAVSSLWHIYRKVGPAENIRITFPKRLKRSHRTKPISDVMGESAYWAVLEKFDFPSVLIDEQFNILRVYGNTGPFLRLPPGRPTLNLLDLAQPAWIGDLRNAAKQAVAEGYPVSVADLRDNETGEDLLSIRLMPFQRGEDSRAHRLLVSFMRSAPSCDLALPKDGTEGKPNEKVSENLSDALRITIEELEASREELQILNEELRAVNDQLNLSNEEINEVNAQLRAKIRELETQSNVLSSGGVITLFLDGALRIRWFTSAATELFPLRTSDTERLITELVPKFRDPHFVEDARKVIKTGKPLETEVRNADERWYVRRICPYRTENGKIKGVTITFTDITERKQTEEALRNSEYRLRRFYDSGLLGVIYWNMDGQIVDANDKFLEMVGYDREDLIAGRIAWQQMTPPEYRYLDEKGIKDLLATGVNAAPFEKEFVRKDGSRLPVIVAGAMLDEARFNGVAFVLDISARKRAETALQRERSLLVSVMQATDFMLVLLDTRFNFVWVNPAYADTCGMKPEEMIGKNHFVLYPDAENEAIFRHVRDTGEAVCYKDKPFVFPDQPERGTTYWDWSLSPIREADGSITGLVFSLRETTKFKQAQEALIASEDRLSFALNTSRTGAWDLDLADNTAYCSLEHDRIFGYNRPLPKWTYEKFQEHVVPEDRAAVDALFREAVQSCSDWSFECRIRRADGEIRWIWASGRPRLNSSGKPFRMTGIVQDITERKQAEEEAQAQRNLFEIVINQLPVAVSIVRASDLKIMLVNPQYRKIAPQKEMIGKTLLEAWPEVLELEKLFREVADTGIPFSTTDALYKIKRSDDGPLEEAYFSWSVFRIRLPGNEGWGLLSTGWETTDRRKAEETLRQALAKSEQIG